MDSVESVEVCEGVIVGVWKCGSVKVWKEWVVFSFIHVMLPAEICLCGTTLSEIREERFSQ